MRNLILAGAAGFALALSSASAFAIPRTAEIMSQGQMTTSDQTAVGAFLPVPDTVETTNVYAPAHQYVDHGYGANTGAGVGGSSSHR